MTTTDVSSRFAALGVGDGRCARRCKVLTDARGPSYGHAVTAPDETTAAAAGDRTARLRHLAAGAAVGVLGGMIGLGGAEVRSTTAASTDCCPHPL